MSGGPPVYGLVAFVAALALAVGTAQSKRESLSPVPFGYHDEFRGHGGSLLGEPMTGSGASFGRLHISPWNLGYPDRIRAPEDKWPEIDLALDMARKYGRGLLLSVYDKKAVRAGPEFTEFVAAVLQHAANRGVEVIGLEVWNEPNIPAFGSLAAEDLVALARSAFEARRQAGSSVPIIAGGLFAGASGEWIPYLRTVRDMSHEWLELSVHPYAFSPSRRRQVAGAIADMRRASRIAGDRGLWVTEAGFAGYASSERFQRRAGLRLYREARVLGYRGFVWYRLQDDLDDAFYGYGALRSDGTPKPLYGAIGEGRG